MNIDFQLKELSPNSRFSIHNVPPLPPGCCFVCKTGSVDDRKFLYFGKSFPMYGAIYFCSECIREIAEALGYYPAEVLRMLMNGNEELQATNQDLKLKLKETNESLRTLARTFSDFDSFSNGSDSSDDKIDEADSESESDDSEPFELDGLEGLGSIRSVGDD